VPQIKGNREEFVELDAEGKPIDTADKPAAPRKKVARKVARKVASKTAAKADSKPAEAPAEGETAAAEAPAAKADNETEGKEKA